MSKGLGMVCKSHMPGSLSAYSNLLLFELHIFAPPKKIELKSTQRGIHATVTSQKLWQHRAMIRPARALFLRAVLYLSILPWEAPFRQFLLAGSFRSPRNLR